MSIISGIVNVGRAVLRIGKIVVPLLRGLRGMVPEIDKLFDGVDEAVADGGVIADDYFDRNLSTIGDMREVGLDLELVGQALVAACDEIVVASQVDTPDKITVEEGQAILEKTNLLRAALADLLTKADGLEEKIETLE